VYLPGPKEYAGNIERIVRDSRTESLKLKSELGRIAVAAASSCHLVVVPVVSQSRGV
jgi:hypothetical protein